MPETAEPAAEPEIAVVAAEPEVEPAPESESEQGFFARLFGGAEDAEDSEIASETETQAAEPETIVAEPEPAAMPETAEPAAEPEIAVVATEPEPEMAAEPLAEETAGEETAGADETQIAALPPAAPVEGQVLIAFPVDSAALDEVGKSALGELVQRLLADETMRVQLLAYAGGSEDTASRSRRMSLSRALAVRTFLIEQGVRSTRMDVRALGNKVAGDPADRVDVIPQAP